uniref:HTH myb-type domain-containing protein n=1 Tax=Favella ehrenbergii TaxID=182087 RepID=A0A7S3MJV5_9SPIT|mmetsp:Transcript_21693/g.26702  ORF Transcript_21693/g.26702 Transcript_21693/m.26702 type:complete len:187 (+) Transcript_21693:513-1073(+)
MMLEENKRLLLAGFEELNSNDDLGKTVALLDHMHCNMMYLTTAADFQANSRFALRENRELICKEDLEQFQKDYPLQDSLFTAEDYLFGIDKAAAGSGQGALGMMQYQRMGLATVRNSERPQKQKKQPWTLEEKKLFKEALDRYGPKALKEISEHVGTRTLIQCRSHLQKYQIKVSKGQAYIVDEQT